MKRIFNLKTLATVVSFFFLHCPGFSAVEPPEKDHLFQHELKQQQIKTSTDRVAAQLESIIEEFDLNGLGGDEVRILRTIRGVLSKLSEKEMEKVIASLQQAREDPHPVSSIKNVADAFAGQRVIILQLQQLLAEYERQQALQGLASYFRELGVRQNANLKLALSLARETENKSQMSDANLANLRYQEIQQDALKEETALGLKGLEDLVGKMTDVALVGRLKPLLKQTRETGLSPALEAALEGLKTGKLLSAAGSEKKAWDELRLLARRLIQSDDPSETLRQALQEVEKVMGAQKDLIEETQKLENKGKVPEVAENQTELAETTDLIKTDVANLAPAAAEHLQKSIAQMREANRVLAGEKPAKEKQTQAPISQGQALKELQNAHQLLGQDLAKQLEKDESPNLLADLKGLQKEIRELSREEEKLKNESAAREKNQKELGPLSPLQIELKKKTQALQQNASELAPVAKSLNDAANQMAKSEEALAQNKNNPAAQQAAIDALNRAEQQVGSELAKLEESEKKLDQLEKLREEVGHLIEKQQEIQIGTAKESSEKSPAKLAPLSSSQKNLESETAKVQAAAVQAAPEVSSNLGQARGHMAKAQNQLEKSQPAAASPEQKSALENLYQARQNLDAAMADLAQQLGMSPALPADSAASAAQRIERAQGMVSQAMAQLQQPAAGLLESLQKQQEQIANDLQEMNSTATTPSLTQSEKSAREAAAQLSRANLPGTVAAMERARQSMQAAVNEKPKPGIPPKSSQKSPAKPLPSAGTHKSNLENLGTRQEKLEKTAKSLIDSQKNSTPLPTREAANMLSGAAEEIAPLTAGELPNLPLLVEAALESAEQALASGVAEASSSQVSSARQSAGTAAEALARAKAALAMADAGLSAPPSKGQGMAMKGEGQGQSSAQGQGQGQAKGKGRAPGQKEGQGSGDVGNWAEGGSVDGGARRTVSGSGKNLTLPKRERAALEQSQKESYSPEYAPVIEQYLRNLSDQAERAK